MKGKLLFLIVLLSLILAACGAEEAATPEAAVPSEAPTAEPTTAPVEAATEPPAAPEPTAVPTEPPMPEPTEPIAVAEVAKTLRLPDLEGRTVVAVTGNDYTPLNFVDPLTGEAVGWEYDAVNEICRRLNCQVDWQVTAWDTMICGGEGRPV